MDKHREAFGNRARQYIADGYGFDVNADHVICPLHGDTKPSMGWFEDGLCYKCHSGSCGKTIDIYNYLEDVEGITDFNARKDWIKERVGGHYTKTSSVETFTAPDLTRRDLKDQEMEVLSMRGFTQKTVEDWKVKAVDIKGQAWFRFLYKDDDGKFPYQNSRLAVEPCPQGKKAIPTPNTKPILWGMWHDFDYKQPLVITEGQFDAMAVWQSGWKNVVSVPAGSSNMTWIKHCFSFLRKFSLILVYGDNDDAGRKMIDTIAERLGKDRVRAVEHPCKDANDVMLTHGEPQILKDIQNCIDRPPEGLIILSQCDDEIPEDGEATGFRSGFRGLDYTMGNFQPGELTIVFGRNGEGKSTWISQICCNNIEEGTPIFLYSGEMSDQKLKRWLCKQATGMKEGLFYVANVNYSGLRKKEFHVKPSVKRAINQWIANKMIVVDKERNSVRQEKDRLFKLMALAKKKYGCGLFLIDNLMSAVEMTDKENALQTNFVASCVEFAHKNNAHVMLVCHPNKQTCEGTRLAKNNISGTANIQNFADNIIGIEKLTEEEQAKCVGPMHGVNGCMHVLKQREDGIRKSLYFRYDTKSKRMIDFLNIEELELYRFDREPQYTWFEFLKEI